MALTIFRTRAAAEAACAQYAAQDHFTDSWDICVAPWTPRLGSGSQGYCVLLRPRHLLHVWAPVHEDGTVRYTPMADGTLDDEL
jgi:hypothetical protein